MAVGGGPRHLRGASRQHARPPNPSHSLSSFSHGHLAFSQYNLVTRHYNSGKGVIVAHAVNADNLSSFLSGVVATARSANNPSNSYVVTYSSGHSSSSDGLVFVLNVDACDTVTLGTTKIAGVLRP
jgi:hypothetical protein